MFDLASDLFSLSIRLLRALPGTPIGYQIASYQTSVQQRYIKTRWDVYEGLLLIWLQVYSTLLVAILGVRSWKWDKVWHSQWVVSCFPLEPSPSFSHLDNSTFFGSSLSLIALPWAVYLMQVLVPTEILYSFFTLYIIARYAVAHATNNIGFILSSTKVR